MKVKIHKNDLPNNLNLGKIIAIDTETMGLDYKRDPLCLVQISSGNEEVHLIQINRKTFKADNLKKMTPSSTPQTPMYIDGKRNPEWREQQQKKYEDKKKEAEEIRDNSYAETLEMFSDLNETRSESVVSFNSKYSSLNLDDKKKYLYHLYDSDKLNKEEY